MVVAPSLTNEEPLQCVREPMLSWMGRGSDRARFEGRREGFCFRWAWRRALGEMRGIADAGTELPGVEEAGIDGMAAIQDERIIGSGHCGWIESE